MALPPTTSHTARRGLLATAIGLAALLIVAAGLLWWRGTGLSDRVVEVQGEGVLRAVHRGFMQGDGPPDAEVLRGVLEGERAAGLRWIGMVRADGTIEAQAGQPHRDRLELPGGHERLWEADGMWWMAPVPLLAEGAEPRWMPPPPGAGPRPPPRGGKAPPAGRPPPPRPGADGGPPAVPVVAFDAHVADQLTTDVRRAFGAALATGLALLWVAFVFERLARRAEVAEDALTERQRLADLGEMSAVLAHEIRNPLAALKGHAQLLEEALEGSPQGAQASRVVGTAERLERLANDLLDFARTGGPRREVVDPGALVETEALAVDPSVQVDRGDAPAAWSLDPDRVRQVIANLVRNAVDAGGLVQVRVFEDAGELVVDVADGGPGIDPDIAAHLFEPFRTTKTRGVGLGLAVSRRIVQSHGGTIVPSPRDGGGTRFRVRIPDGA